jgi:uncharacterized protein YbbK (DUF523 family)
MGRGAGLSRLGALMPGPVRILVSACLLGQPVRYDGSHRQVLHATLEIWRREGRLVASCPEVAAGLATPRPAAEILDGLTGSDVLEGRARVAERTGQDVTPAFVDGARIALLTALRHNCRLALLMDGSPSCGSRRIHDGSFTGRSIEGRGVTAELLERHGIRVFTCPDIEAAGTYLRMLERGPA